MAKTDTKEKLIAASADIIHEKGFNNTGIKEILDACQVPKGSFYFYFKSKKDLGLAVIDYHGQRFAAITAKFLGDKNIPPLVRLENMFSMFVNKICENGFVRGCPIGNLCQEMSDLDQDFRLRLNKSLRGLSQGVAKVLEEAAGAGELAPDSDPEQLAGFIVNSWQGALLAMKVEKSRRPLDAFMNVVFNMVLKK